MSQKAKTMPDRPFYIVDVFAEQRYAGNQLAVIRHADGLTSAAMQRIALEMNYSETTFIMRDELRDGGVDVRIFTAETELPFAGHPTLGTAYIINHEILPTPQTDLLLNMQAGQIPVQFADDGVIWMRQNPPTFGATFDHAAFAAAIGVPLDAVDTRFPVQIVSTGLPFTIAALKTLDAVKSIKVNWAAFNTLIGQHVSGDALDGLMVFAPETYQLENTLNARVVFDVQTMPEDPATGSANGCLAGYLSHHHYFGDDRVDCRVEQGYEIKRPSLLLLRAHADGDTVAVNVGGRVFMVARGTLLG